MEQPVVGNAHVVRELKDHCDGDLLGHMVEILKHEVVRAAVRNVS